MKDENQRVQGFVDVCIEDLNKNKVFYTMQNAILKKGKEALAMSLANEIGDMYSFYISKMIFGDGGALNSSPKIVDGDRSSLFGKKVISKPIIANIDPSITSQVVFTSVIKYSEINGSVINEMALEMNNGNLYSMVTFPNLTKTENMQITWNWRINFL
jgi:hypothetical protein